jgi:predicted ester cyclase
LAQACGAADFAGGLLFPRGKKVFWTENHIYRLNGGRIAEAWSEVSFHDLIAQISSPAPKAAQRA